MDDKTQNNSHSKVLMISLLDGDCIRSANLTFVYESQQPFEDQPTSDSTAATGKVSFSYLGKC